MDHLQTETNRYEGLSTGKIREIVETIVASCNPERVVLFGSHAQGISGPESDLDLLVVMPSSLPRHKRAAPIRLLFRPSPCPMDILVYTPEEVNAWGGMVNHIITIAMQTGRVLYEKA
ncbi:MAG: nucleotidyltransferase domain-containing protein [Magnetococcales bacterium]|nr:nucleotidyltransferase domain-containing protein [Magnetococcales bacterium]